MNDVPDRLYLYGGIMAVGISTSLILLLDYLTNLLSVKESWLLLFIEAFLTFLIAGFVAGHLVTRNASQKFEMVGLKTGVYASLLNLIIMLLHSTLIGALWAICGYLLGGGFSGLLYSFMQRRRY